ncbi:HET domain containing protein [Hyaloscypha variabilis]
MSPATDIVCKNCSDLDLRAIFAGNFEMEDEFISRKSDTSLRWAWNRTENCQFCHFIDKCSAYRTIVYDPPELDAQLEPRWLKRESFKWFGFKTEDVVLRLVFDTPLSDESWLDDSRSKNSIPHSLIGCTAVNDNRGADDTIGPIRGIPSYVESFDALKRSFEHVKGQKTSVPIPNLLLIDCVSRQVVTAPYPCRYLALSYVWGKQKARAFNIGEKLLSLPQTIEDAMIVTSKLDFQYLWVDMYCIKQDDQNHVGDQIRHMDLVYRRAQATIIAAAGDNPDFGLPGVSSSRQTRQAHATMNGISMASFTHNPWELVDSSTWNSRAWTFQESLFSPRRIFFTTEQMIYNCLSGWKCESVELTQPPTLDSDNRYRIYRNWMVRPAPPTFQQYSTKAIYHLIREYSSRQLSFSKDVLNAFSGVLHAYETLPSPVKNLWGVPIVPTERFVLESLNMGLSWEFAATKALPSVNRRRDFPSWSWTGWDCPVVYKDWYSTRAEYLPMHELNADVEITEGSKVSWVNIKLAIMKDQHQLCNTLYLRIEAWTTPVVLNFPMEESEEVASSSFRRAYAIIGQEGHWNMFRAQVPSLRNSAELDRIYIEQYGNAYLCAGILLGGFRKTGHNFAENPLLLVAKRGTFWERLGITYLTERFRVEKFKKSEKRALVSDWIKNEVQLSRETMYLG